MIDKTNMGYIKTLTDEEVFNRNFSCGYLIQSNQHLELFQNLKDLVLSTYEVTAEFQHKGYNGDKIVANNQTLVYRPNKFSPVVLGKNVEVVKGKFTDAGGSHNYPSVGHQGMSATLKFISYGLPCVDSVNGWSIKIININKI